MSFESDRYFTEYVGVHPYVTHVPFVRLLQWFFFVSWVFISRQFEKRVCSRFIVKNLKLVSIVYRRCCFLLIIRRAVCHNMVGAVLERKEFTAANTTAVIVRPCSANTKGKRGFNREIVRRIEKWPVIPKSRYSLFFWFSMIYGYTVYLLFFTWCCHFVLIPILSRRKNFNRNERKMTNFPLTRSIDMILLLLVKIRVKSFLSVPSYWITKLCYWGRSALVLWIPRTVLCRGLPEIKSRHEL